MTKCNDCGKTWTGRKIEHCKGCHETFNNTRAGDKHRGIDYKYALVRWPNGEIGRMRQDTLNKSHLKLLDIKLISENNQAFRCLSHEEMRAKGMRQEEKNGCWNNGGVYIYS